MELSIPERLKDLILNVTVYNYVNRVDGDAPR